MTLKKIDYSKLVVYKIVCKDLCVTDIYVGSTTNFDQRKKTHKNKCNDKNAKEYNCKLYRKIREYGGFESWSMIIVEKCPCEDSYNARKFERFYYEQLNANLNTNRPLFTKDDRKQYCSENKDAIREQKQLYYEKNKDKLNETITCSCGATITRNNYVRHLKTFKHISKSKSLFQSSDEIITA